MKFFLAIALIVAVASAGIIKPVSQTAEMQQVQEIIAAINSPSTDPATAALLEQLLLETMGLEPISVGPAIVDVAPISPISVGPAIVDAISPISVGPAIIDFPLPEGALGEVVPAPVAPVIDAPAPVAEAPAPVADAAQSSPLVQIIVNVNGAASNPISVAPGAAAEAVVPEVAVDPVHVVEEAINAPEPVQVVDVAPIVPTPVVLPQPIQPEPVVVVNPPTPVVVVESPQPEPISVGTPLLPVPVAPVVLPETLN